jgi:hypothetical protein
MQRTLLDPFEIRGRGPASVAAPRIAHRAKQATLHDPYELRTIADVPAPVIAYRAKEATLHDAYELRAAVECADTLDLGDWEESRRDACKIIVEEPPRGIRSESWCRARLWGTDDYERDVAAERSHARRAT